MSDRVVFLDIDTQYDFMNPGGRLYVPGAEKLTPNLRRLFMFAKDNNIPIISSLDTHKRDDPEFKDDYQLVAVVECRDLEHAFEATNTIHQEWRKNTEVKEFYNDRCRSTSVGDILEEVTEDWRDQGRVFRCENVGWVELKPVKKEITVWEKA